MYVQGAHVPSRAHTKVHVLNMYLKYYVQIMCSSHVLLTTWIWIHFITKSNFKINLYIITVLGIHHILQYSMYVSYIFFTYTYMYTYIHVYMWYM